MLFLYYPICFVLTFLLEHQLSKDWWGCSTFEPSKIISILSNLIFLFWLIYEWIKIQTVNFYVNFSSWFWIYIKMQQNRQLYKISVFFIMNILFVLGHIWWLSQVTPGRLAKFTLGRLGGFSGFPGIKHGLAICKVNTLPVMLSFWFSI